MTIALNHKDKSKLMPTNGFNHPLALVLVVVFFLFGFAAKVWAAESSQETAPDELRFNTPSGLQISLSSRLKPLDINIFHSWVVKLETAKGNPIVGALISVTGGMPDHDHGLPTEPRITEELGDGKYLLEGMRFHMNGNWELILSVQQNESSEPEQATIAFRL